MPNAFVLARFLPFRLNRLAAEVSQRLAAIYAERFGLDIPQWRVLATLSGGPCSAQDIVASTRTHKSTISRAVKDLEKRRLIERGVLGHDKRSYSLRLTASGHKMFKQLQPLVLDYEQGLLDKLEAAETKALLRGLGALEAVLHLRQQAKP
jgi:DNA-binding MarR family transcriptional regulator